MARCQYEGQNSNPQNTHKPYAGSVADFPELPTSSQIKTQRLIINYECSDSSYTCFQLTFSLTLINPFLFICAALRLAYLTYLLSILPFCFPFLCRWLAGPSWLAFLFSLHKPHLYLHGLPIGLLAFYQANQVPQVGKMKQQHIFTQLNIYSPAQTNVTHLCLSKQILKSTTTQPSCDP